jgi:hypothetical protein
MRKSFPIVLAASLVAMAAWAQNVDERELRSVGTPDIVFESYTGAHAAVDTAEEIVGIGKALAESLRADGRRGDFYGLFSVIRAVDPTEKQKLDADIIVFEKKAGVDHINNVRRIIAGYVEGAFGAARADAELLAVFVTYYNAVYRGKLDELGARYSAAVMSNLTADNAGLALSYREWPGRTRILLPFVRAGVAGVPQPAGAMSTTELTQSKVVEQLRTEPDKGLPERKAMVDLKEREVEKAKEAVAAAEAAVAEQKAQVAKREEALAAARTAPAKPLAEAPAKPVVEPSASPSAEASAKPVVEPLAKPSAEAPAKPATSPEAKALADEKAKLAESEKQLAAQKDAVAAKQAEIAVDRQGIVADEKATPATTATPAAAAPQVSESVLYLAGRGSAEGGRLVVVDPAKRAVSAASAVAGITGGDFAYFKDSVVVLAREGQAVHLLLLDPKTLAVRARGQDPMEAAGYVHSQAGAIYAVIQQDGAARLARYDEKLARTALSADAVERDTYIRIFGEEVYASAPDGTILVLSAADLSLKGRVQGSVR